MSTGQPCSVITASRVKRAPLGSTARVPGGGEPLCEGQAVASSHMEASARRVLPSPERSCPGSRPSGCRSPRGLCVKVPSPQGVLLLNGETRQQP